EAPNGIATTGPATRASRARMPLAGSMVLFLIVAVLSFFMEPHRIEGSLRTATEDSAQLGSRDVPTGEWHAYGRTDFGQRYSPLDLITPDNVSELEVAWHYKTGDVRSGSDPEETTFQVT